MATSAKISNPESTVNILKLHEDIFREIFGYLEVKTVYFTIRHVCRQIRNYVDGYVKLDGVFMLTAGLRNPTEILYLFTETNGAKFIYSKEASYNPHSPIGCYSSGFVLLNYLPF